MDKQQLLQYAIYALIAIASVMGLGKIPGLMDFIKKLPFLNKFFKDETPTSNTPTNETSPSPTVAGFYGVDPNNASDLLWVVGRVLTKQGNKEAAKQAYDLSLSLSSKEDPLTNSNPQDILDAIRKNNELFIKAVSQLQESQSVRSPLRDLA